MKKITKRLVTWVLIIPLYSYFKKKGVINFNRMRLLSYFIDDLLFYKGASLKQKLWAYRRGFFLRKSIGLA